MRTSVWNSARFAPPENADVGRTMSAREGVATARSVSALTAAIESLRKRAMEFNPSRIPSLIACQPGLPHEVAALGSFPRVSDARFGAAGYVSATLPEPRRPPMPYPEELIKPFREE